MNFLCVLPLYVSEIASSSQ